jgi:hypothetical protein
VWGASFVRLLPSPTDLWTLAYRLQAAQNSTLSDYDSTLSDYDSTLSDYGPPKTIGQLIDEVERILEDLRRLQRELEKMESLQNVVFTDEPKEA